MFLLPGISRKILILFSLETLLRTSLFEPLRTPFGNDRRLMAAVAFLSPSPDEMEVYCIGKFLITSCFLLLPQLLPLLLPPPP